MSNPETCEEKINFVDEKIFPAPRSRTTKTTINHSNVRLLVTSLYTMSTLFLVIVNDVYGRFTHQRYVKQQFAFKHSMGQIN